MIPLWTSLALAAPFPDLLQPPANRVDASPDAAVVVGMEDYGVLPSAPFARRDAMAVRTWLVHGLGVPADRVQLLQSANRELLLTAIDTGAAAVEGDGKLIVWFSGHGATSPVDGSMLLVGDDASPSPTPSPPAACRSRSSPSTSRATP